MICGCCALPPLRKPDPSECTDGCPSYPEGCGTCGHTIVCDHCSRRTELGNAYCLTLPEPDAKLLHFCSEECLKDWLSVQKRKVVQ